MGGGATKGGGKVEEVALGDW
ncbi:hypothetical protein CCACVL1_00129 [Corchorus capsularis]|uniref:Uncharacterized protein n=1 Tax=Corchorus capsularis TaxID=210143 RepID=A0A1R3KMR1_COCAP|nr:hypothetical protein CCACVL1_01132 [Corchorus capsularis]OMP12096.1 hypothetical protein CCACVL1_00129 [Corchorus capsularis]